MTSSIPLNIQTLVDFCGRRCPYLKVEENLSLPYTEQVSARCVLFNAPLRPAAARRGEIYMRCQTCRVQAKDALKDDPLAAVAAVTKLKSKRLPPPQPVPHPHPVAAPPAPEEESIPCTVAPVKIDLDGK